MKMKLTVMLLGAFLLSGCISYEQYDLWEEGKYESKKKELEEFQRIRDRYPVVIDFDTQQEISYLNGQGKIEDGCHHYRAKGEEEHERVPLAEEIGSYKAFGLCIKAQNSDGFVEILFGVKNGEEITIRTAGEPIYKFSSGAWTLLEVEKIGGGTVLSVNGKERYRVDFPFQTPTIFYFGKGQAKIDYLLLKE